MIRSATNERVDAITLEVIANALAAIADQEALILMRSACSSIVRDTMDFSTAICDAQGRTLAQGLCQPLHMGAFDDPMSFLIERFSGNVRPGDVYIGNDPYASMGQHLPDIFIIKPIFQAGNLEGWVTTIAHHADVGGIVPGSNALGATEIYQEGLRLPFLKLHDAGDPNQAIWDIIALNVRVPDKVVGDLKAQIAACYAGEREFLRLLDHYGADTIHCVIEQLHDYAEELTRVEITDMPDGVYEFTDHIDGLGDNPKPITLRLRLVIKGDRATVDWTGSSPQVKGGINSTLPYTKAAGYTALRAVMSSDIPTCFGFTRPIETIAPSGTLVNPLPPGPCGARGITGYRMVDCLYGAISKFAPTKVAADSSGGSTLPAFGGLWKGKPFVFAETLMGTWGGTAAHDGQDGVTHTAANQSNTPVEMIEREYPLRIERYGLVNDSGGPGRFRGGLALTREYRVLTDDVVVTIRSDKRDHPPHGLFGGLPGGSSWNIVNPGPHQRILPVLLTKPEILGTGDLLRHVMAGGGGFGDPLERDPELVMQDVLDRRVSVARARDAYGVVIMDGRPPVLDIEGTKLLRATMRKTNEGTTRSDGFEDSSDASVATS